MAGVFRVHDSMTFYPFPSFDLVLQIVLSHVLSPWFGVFVHFSVFGFCRIVTVPFYLVFDRGPFFRQFVVGQWRVFAQLNDSKPRVRSS